LKDKNDLKAMTRVDHKRIILIIEDSLTDQEMYRRYLTKDSRYNYQIIGVETGEEGLECLSEIAPDLILMDFLLPDMDGLELIEILRQEISLDIPVIMLTGQGDVQVAVQAMKSGFQDYLVKGNVTPESLLKTVDSVFERVKLLKQIERNQQQRRLVSTIALRIRQSLNLEEILQASVNEVRSFLNCDRVVVYQFKSHLEGRVISESVGEGWLKTINISSQDLCCHIPTNRTQVWEKSHANNDIYQAEYSDCHIQMLERFQIKANLIFPIIIERKEKKGVRKYNIKPSQLWGLLIAHQCDDFRQWEKSELELLEELSVQIAISIQQAQLYHNLKQLNHKLENKVQERTAKLKESEQKFRAIFNNSFQLTGLLAIDGIVLELNQTALNWENVSREEILNRPFWEIPTCQRASTQTQANIQESISRAAQGEFLRYEIDTFDAQGNTLTLDFSLRPLLDEAGKVIFLIPEARDITERKKAEEILRKANIELERTTRLKDEFIANMSHELRTPLNAILGLSEALEQGIFGMLNSQQSNSISTVRKSGTHLLYLINDILDLSKIESGKFKLNLEQVNLKALCNSSLDCVRHQAFNKNIKLNSQITQDVTEIEADERHLRQVLVNLLGNAVKFTPEQGEVTLIVSVNFAESTISFKVSDTGIGIAPEEQEKIFQPFVQIDSRLSKSYPGTGLGLALVKHITEMHKGQVHLQSELGQGSLFTVTLPFKNYCKDNAEKEGIFPENYAQDLNDKPSKKITEHHQKPTKPLILIAAHNEANVDSIIDYFELKGYQLIVAKNGLEAIQIAKQQQPQLILMDLKMPGMDGLEAIRRIRSEPDTALIKIVALTAFAMPEDREKCLQSGATDYLAKPFSLKNLSNKIEQLLSQESLK
jgi:PAS domain S-box-containing protein